MSLKVLGIDPGNREQNAEDTAKWSSSIHKGSMTCEANRNSRSSATEASWESQSRRKTVRCPYCWRTFQARVSLVIIVRTHRQIQAPQPWDD